MEYPISIDSISVDSIIVFDIFLTISGYSVKKQIALTQEDSRWYTFNTRYEHKNEPVNGDAYICALLKPQLAKVIYNFSSSEPLKAQLITRGTRDVKN